MSIKKILKKIKPVYYVGHAIKKVIREVRIYRLAKNGYICGLKGKKALFYFPFIKTDEIQQSIFFGQKYYENDYLDFLCEEWHEGVINDKIKNGTIIDIGSNIGNHSLYFMMERGAKFAYVFEPAKDTFEIMMKNMEINHLENCTKLFNAGVGSGKGKAILTEREKNTAYTQLTLSEEGDIDVISIDELGIKEKVDFVKIDVEGFELEVIKGMRQLLRRDMPYVMIEIWYKNLDEVCNIMQSLGYNKDVMGERSSQGDYLFYK